MSNLVSFDSCCQTVLEGRHFQIGVGSLGEKSLHAALKNYYCPNPANQEINIGSFIADIADESGITEIQTGNFGRIRNKLAFFLSCSQVRVVYPVAEIKWVRWLNPETGELSLRRKSPKKNSIYRLFRELYSLGVLVKHPSLRFTAALLEVEEIRLLNGWSQDRKKGSRKNESIPIRLIRELELQSPADFFGLLPAGLDSTFTVQEVQRLAKLSPRQAYYVVRVLRTMGAVEEDGKKGRCVLYRSAP